MTGGRPDQPLIAAQDPGDGQGRPADHMLPVTSSDTEPASEWLQLIGPARSACLRCPLPALRVTEQYAQRDTLP